MRARLRRLLGQRVLASISLACSVAAGFTQRPQPGQMLLLLAAVLAGAVAFGVVPFQKKLRTQRQVAIDRSGIG